MRSPCLIAGLLCLLSISGCSSLRGTMLDGRVCTLATDKDVQGFVDVVVASLPPTPEREAAMLAQSLAKLGAVALCEAARKAEAGQPVVVEGVK